MQNSWFEISWQITVKIPARVLGFLLLRITLRPLEQALLAALLNLPSPILQLVAMDKPTLRDFAGGPLTTRCWMDSMKSKKSIERRV